MKMKISEDQKMALFACYSQNKLYAKTDTDYGRFSRGVINGVTSILHGMGLDIKDIMPKQPPDSPSMVYAGFMAAYSSYLSAEQEPRVAKNSEDHLMLFGRDAQNMMKEVEADLKKWEKETK